MTLPNDIEALSTAGRGESIDVAGVAAVPFSIFTRIVSRKARDRLLNVITLYSQEKKKKREKERCRSRAGVVAVFDIMKRAACSLLSTHTSFDVA